jgi:DNA-binding MarR family transcriptional regulator
MSNTSIQERLHQTKHQSPREQAFVSLLYIAGRMMQRLEDVCASYALTHSQYNVLRILRGVYPEGHPRCDIVDRLITRAPDVTRLLDRLERQGWVERGSSRENRRLSVAKITPEGLKLLEKIDPDIQRLQQEIMHGLSAAESKHLSAICDRIAATLDGKA